MQRMLSLPALLCVECFIDMDAHERRLSMLLSNDTEYRAQFMVEVFNYRKEMFVFVDI